MNEKVYISGKITGLVHEEAFRKFESAEKVLSALGHEPVNPMKLFAPDPVMTWRDYMVKDIQALFECSAIYMLTNWRDSAGARIEHAIAVETKIKILYQ